ncbi:MAG: hypothetical protein ABSB99_11590 [Acidimicrobiales bacterium]|jgi:hypothetical protein
MKVQDIHGGTAILGGSRLLFKSALVLVFAAGLGACGGAAKSNSTASNSRSSALAAYSNCLKEHGVTLPANFAKTPRNGSVPSGSLPEGSLPTGSVPQGNAPSGVNSSKFQAAEAACRSKLPSGGFGGAPGGGTPGSGSLSNFAAFSSCMSDNGVKLKGTGPSALASLNQNDPAVQSAMKKCSPLLQSGSTSTTMTG